MPSVSDQFNPGANPVDFSIANARKEIKDLFAYKVWIYWFDFIFSAAVGWTSFYFACTLTLFSSLQLLAFTSAIVFMYRAALFVHEIVHFKKDSVPYFSLVWNLTFGIFIFVPSLLYKGIHNDHHSKLIYGTPGDGEYIPFGTPGPSKILKYLATIFLSPITLFVRFTILAPLSLMHPHLRRLLMESLSSLVIDFSYIRPKPRKNEMKEWYWQESLCSLWGISVTTATLVGAISARYAITFYALFVAIFFLNTIRTLVAHRYRNEKDSISVHDQILDSVNVTSNSPFTLASAPVGLRFHALHHMFPTLPYHSLGAAHKRLIAKAEFNNFYQHVNEKNIWVALHKLWKTATAPKVTLPQPKQAELNFNSAKKNTQNLEEKPKLQKSDSQYEHSHFTN